MLSASSRVKNPPGSPDKPCVSTAALFKLLRQPDYKSRPLTGAACYIYAAFVEIYNLLHQ
ncbi:hypothetical protein D3C72_2550890 [compost metagenome]